VFISAIEQVAAFTRPIHIISRFWGSTDVIPGAATLFFVNSDGWALTCGHVAKHLAASDQIGETFRRFKDQRNNLPGGSKGKRRQALRDLERQHGYQPGAVCDVQNTFVGCIEGVLDLEARIHKLLDVALLKFSNFSRLNCDSFPLFAASGDDLRQGKFLCRLGYPFPEFTHFEYDPVADEIRWTSTGRQETPRFPIEGMVTRHLADTAGKVVGFELSTPGLKGQSGGPAFDTDGCIWGMQSATRHIDLDFDVDMEVFRAGHKRRVKESAFLHVGHCVHVNALKEFMGENGVKFQER